LKGYIVGGIQARSLETLAQGLVRDAQESDGHAESVSYARHVNCAELRQLCERVLILLRSEG